MYQEESFEKAEEEMHRQIHRRNAKGERKIGRSHQRRVARRKNPEEYAGLPKKLWAFLKQLADNVRAMVLAAKRMFTIDELRWLKGWKASPSSPLPI